MLVTMKSGNNVELNRHEVYWFFFANNLLLNNIDLIFYMSFVNEVDGSGKYILPMPSAY